MSVRRLTRSANLDPARLRVLLGAFFLALALPIGALVWHGYSQLQWEAFHQYRGLAEELTKRIDTKIAQMTKVAESRPFADYSFLNVAGDPSANFLQRSPLARFPVVGDLPGAIGYFQVGAQGEFTTPLLPARHAAPAQLGIGETEYAERQRLADEIQSVLSDNRLVQYRPQGDDDELVKLEDSQQRIDAGLSAQVAFDDLNRSNAPESARRAPGRSDKDSAASQAPGKLTQGRVADLKLDSAYEKKSAKRDEAEATDALRRQDRLRVSRKEKESVPETVYQIADAELDLGAEPGELRISTFESEIDPLEFSLLDSGHLVLFRRVWRDGERYIQGLLLDQSVFISTVLANDFRDTALSAMSDMVVAWRDDVLFTVSASSREYLPVTAEEHRGALLYRSRLAAPLDAMELIYTVRRLPPGPGAGVLGWVTLILAVVFCGGFYVLYRAAFKQLELARQQQDFVSAVSHELKTPLTSIRMYGEMLKEGWADDAKKQVYYEYIYDESERLGRLISNVLQLASLSRNEPNLDVKSAVVGELMSRMQAKIEDQVKRADFVLAFVCAEEVANAAVDVDEDCFAQIIINLVDNAIKFSRDASDKRIEIAARLSGDSRVVFSVRDHGPGIARDQMKNIFDMFYRSESELTRETVGTGIGLAIVHQLSAAMGARVDVLNREPGAEFLVTFRGH